MHRKASWLLSSHVSKQRTQALSRNGVGRSVTECNNECGQKGEITIKAEGEMYDRKLPDFIELILEISGYHPRYYSI